MVDILEDKGQPWQCCNQDSTGIHYLKMLIHFSCIVIYVKGIVIIPGTRRCLCIEFWKWSFFNVWHVDFMEPFVPSNQNKYILVVVDYVLKCVEVAAFPRNDVKVVIKFLRRKTFLMFGTPKDIISDEGSYFCKQSFKAFLTKYRVKHRVVASWHSQTSGQAEISNQEIKKILEKIVGHTRRDLSIRLGDALWAYKTVYPSCFL